MTKGPESIIEFLQNVKAQVDELVRAVQGRDTPISFEELHEKLLNFEATLNITRPMI